MPCTLVYPVSVLPQKLDHWAKIFAKNICILRFEIKNGGTCQKVGRGAREEGGVSRRGGEDDRPQLRFFVI